MKIPQTPAPNTWSVEWGMYCRAEAQRDEAQAHLLRVQASTWETPMREQEQKFREDTKMKADELAAKMEHSQRVQRMIFWKAVYAQQEAAALEALRLAQARLEHWEQTPMISIRKKKMIKEGALL